MLARKYRVPKTAFASSKKTAYRSSYVIVKTAPNTCGHNRVAVVVSKNISKTAVKRNKIKRMVVKYSEGLFQGKKHEGKDIIIIAQKEMKDVEEKNVSKEMEKIVKTIS